MQMAEDFPSRNKVLKRKYITDEQVATFIVDVRNGLLLDAFVGDKGQSASAVAEKLNVQISTLYYKIRKMLEYNLIEICRVEKRTGRPIKYYRLSAEEFFLPLEFTPFPTLEYYLRSHLAPIQELAVKGCATSLERMTDGVWGISVKQKKGKGEVKIVLQADPPQTNLPKAHAVGWRFINLSRKQAQILTARVTELMESPEVWEGDDSEDEKQPYVMYTVVVPTV